jgi:hypothetical protein
MYNIQHTPVPAQDSSGARSWEPGSTLVRFVCSPDVLLNIIAVWDRCYLVPVPGTILLVVHCAVHVRCRVGTGSSLDVQVHVQPKDILYRSQYTLLRTVQLSNGPTVQVLINE